MRTIVAVVIVVLFLAGGADAQGKGASAVDVKSLKESPEDILGICKTHAEDFSRAKKAGCKIVNLPQYGTFFVYWLPEGFGRLREKRVLVMMHGSNGNAYRHILNMTDAGGKFGFGLVSIQWGWPSGKLGRYRYLSPMSSYRIMTAAVEYMALRHGIDKHLTAWNGFSRSSTQCAIYAFLDRQSGNDYFNFFIAVSGGIGPEQRMVRDLLSGRHGERPIEGEHFYLWNGKQDVRRTECMRNSVSILEKLGGAVTFRETAGIHGGFYHKPLCQAEAVELWKEQCRRRR